MKKPAGKARGKHLHPDEEHLWEQTAQSVKPLKRGKARVRAAAEMDVPSPPPRAKAEVKSAAQTAKAKAEAGAPAVVPVKKSAPPIAGFDRKAARKIRSGRVEIEARIDLHGMRQDEAYGALIAFLRRAQGKGQRWVLVITGKGKAGPRDDDDTPFDMTRDRSRGILKLNVPRWLEEPDVRAFVVSYTTAAISHGGEGALYVHLRKRG